MNSPVSGFTSQSLQNLSTDTFNSQKTPLADLVQNSSARSSGGGAISYGAPQSKGNELLGDASQQGETTSDGSALQEQMMQMMQQMMQMMMQMMQKLMSGSQQGQDSGGSDAAPAASTAAEPAASNAAADGSAAGDDSATGGAQLPLQQKAVTDGAATEGNTAGSASTPLTAATSQPDTTATETGSSSMNSGSAGSARPTAEEPNEAGAVDGADSVDPNTNSLTFENKGDKPMTISFTPNAGGGSAIDSITLQPGESRTQNFDEGWNGNVRTDKGDGNNVTLGEVTFNGGANKDQTFYDVSYIEGYNSSMKMQPMQGGAVSGTLQDLTQGAGDDVLAKDASGNAYGIKKSTTSNVQDPNVVNFMRDKVSEARGYVIPTDDASTLGTSSKNLKVDLA